MSESFFFTIEVHTGKTIKLHFEHFLSVKIFTLKLYRASKFSFGDFVLCHDYFSINFCFGKRENRLSTVTLYGLEFDRFYSFLINFHLSDH